MTLGKKVALLIFALSLPAFARASGRIVSMRHTGTNIVLNVSVDTNCYYQLQCRASLMSGEWMDVGAEFLPTEAEHELTVVSEAPHCLFRVVETASSISPPPPPDAPPSSPAAEAEQTPSIPAPPGAPPAAPTSSF